MVSLVQSLRFRQRLDIIIQSGILFKVFKFYLVPLQ